MTTLKTRIADAAFWEAHLCLRCGYTQYPEEDVDFEPTCPQCSSPEFKDARLFVEVLRRVEEEEQWEP